MWWARQGSASEQALKQQLRSGEERHQLNTSSELGVVLKLGCVLELPEVFTDQHPEQFTKSLSWREGRCERENGHWPHYSSPGNWPKPECASESLGSPYNADSALIGLGEELRVCISNR